MKTLATIVNAMALAALVAIGVIGCASDGHNSSGDSAMAAKKAPPQLMFDSPQAAADALVEGARRPDRDELRKILGPNLERLSSGDKEQDDIDLQVFVAAYDVNHALNANDDGTYSLAVGESDWVFPAPIAPDGSYWYFDTAAGVNELITRTISENELSLIDVMDAFVEAQEEFYEMDADGDGIRAYAAVIRSSPGKRDGLYWPDAADAPMSPLGPLVAGAVVNGQLRSGVMGTQPYRGYYFRILTSQGPGAEGGAMNYVDDNGVMTRGYALLAWPASYNETGVMSFIVARSDVVYQKDLGEDTAAAAAGIASFDPADGWQPVP